MTVSVYVASDGNWGSGEPDEFVVLHNITLGGVEQLAEASDSGRWALAQQWALEQNEEG